MNITDFLLARIAEDEERAKLAAFGWGGDWKAIADHEEEWYTVRAEGNREVLGSEDSDVTCHSARHDPARVLAECAAKRAIIELAQKANEAEREWDDYEWQGTVQQTEPRAGDAILYALAAVYKDTRTISRSGWRNGPR